MTEYVNLTIDDIPVKVPKGTTVYTATTELGIDIPIFCYQDRMPPFGACRVCLVEVEKMPKLQTSCTLEAQEGMVVRTQAHPAVKAREEILEFLLINHPLDCPICDRGGECPLQDQALKFGPGKSRFFEDKRRFEKPIYLGPVLTLDRERCIACARCTRFGDIVAGDHALEFIERGYKTEVGTSDGEAPKSKFIGNTILICPVGALTSGVYRFRARPWDNDSTASTCTLCPVGCSMTLDSRDGEIMRTRSTENRAVNDIWLFDKGWFGYEFSSSSKRIVQPLLRRHEELLPVSWDDALAFGAKKMKAEKVAAFGGNNLTVEENYLLQKLVRDVCGSNNVDHRIGQTLQTLDEEGIPAGMQITLGECENLESVILCGVDITEEFPVIWLRLKQAINKGCKITFMGHFAPEVSRYFDKTILHAPGQEMQTLKKEKPSKPSAIFVGRQYLASPFRKAILAELLSWEPSSLNLLEGKNNSMGARLAGMHPELKPLGKRVENPGKNYLQVLEEAAKSGWDLLYIVGCDVASKVPEELWSQARKNIGCLIVQDLFMTKTALDADLFLPTLSFVEKGGSFLNIEGRVQKLKPGKAIPKGVYSDSYIMVKIAQRLGTALVIDEPFLDTLKADSRVNIPRPTQLPAQNLPSFSQEGLYATFAPALFDHGVRMRHNEHLVQLAKEPRVRLHPRTATKRGISEQDQVRLTSQGRSLNAKVQLDDRVAESTVVIPLGFEAVHAHELSPTLLNGLQIEIT